MTQEQFNEITQKITDRLVARMYERNPNAFRGLSDEEAKIVVYKTLNETRSSFFDVLRASQEELTGAFRAAWTQSIIEARREMEKNFNLLQTDKRVGRLFESVADTVERFKNRYQKLLAKIEAVRFTTASPRAIKLTEDDEV